MRVLIVEDRAGGAMSAERRLRAAGHTTVGCIEPGATGPCRALRQPGSCPLDEAPVDVAVLALDPGDASPPAGLLCAASRHIPALSLVGAAEDDGVDLVAAVEQVAALVPPAHAAAAREAAREALDRRGLTDVGAEVVIARDGGSLRINVTTDRPVPGAAAQIAAVRVLAAVRRLDPTAATIGVTVRP